MKYEIFVEMRKLAGYGKRINKFWMSNKTNRSSFKLLYF